ncbi:MAG: hypothetical protein J6O41_08245 [Clostridia bacterium]|nr:hypothetical protein [Clostridia bacterium]
MAENKLSYLNRNFDDYSQSIIDITRQYYPDVFENLNDASVGAWLIDILSDIGDNLNYHIDRNVQETYLDSSKEFTSIQNIARTNGLCIPYKKAALVEIELSCRLPLYQQGSEGDGDMMADETYCPYVKRGTLFSNGTTTFELVHNIDFKEQFNEDGLSDRQIVPNRDSNGTIISYTYKKLAIASASQTRVMKKIVSSNEITPFMEVMINDSNVLGVDSIIVKDGTNINTDPQFNEFFIDEETYNDNSGKPVDRFFEVDNLIDQYRFGYVIEDGENGKYNPEWSEEEVAEIKDEQGAVIDTVVLRKIAKGKWKRLKNKFITEYTDDWKLKVIFGAGIRNKYGDIPQDAKKFTQYQMSRMLANDYMGVLPKSESTMYILYRIGGGEISNIAAGTLTNIISLNIEIEGNPEDVLCSEKIRDVRKSMAVTNTTPSYGGKNEPTTEEIRYMIKYNASSQNRCVTLKDYISRISKIPAKFGCPFRHNAIEENNKIVIYTLGLDYEGHLTNFLSETVADNIKNYLSQYRMINDFVEIKSGKIINLAFRLTVYLDKSYDKSEVTKRIIDLVYDYMDIRKHLMGDDIFVGDLEKEISKLDGVINLVKMRIFNKVGEGYSTDRSTQQLVNVSDCDFEELDAYDRQIENQNEINLEKSDYMLFSEADSMFEIKYKNRDIEVIVKTRN